MSNLISRLPETATQVISHLRDNAKWVAATFGFIAMVYPCSKLLADNLLPTPGEESLLLGKATKDSDLLDTFVNHYSYMGQPSPFVLDPSTTHFIFAMNHENDQGRETSRETTDEAGAQQPQPLVTFSLPPMAYAQVSDIIQGLGSELNQITLLSMLNHVPVDPSDGSLTIADMIETLKQVLNIVPNDDEGEIMEILPSIQGTEPPVNMAKPEDRQALAILLVSYYTAINSSDAPPQAAHDFFSAFLLLAADLSGIEKLDVKRRELLGKNEPIKPDLLASEGTFEEAASVISDMKLLKEMRLKLLQRRENPSEAEESAPSSDRPLESATFLLNHGVNRNEIPIYQRNIKSYERMLAVIKKYDKKTPELIATNNQFSNLINAISLLLDPFHIHEANEIIDNMESYFIQSNWDQTITDSEGNEQKLFEIFKKVLTDAKHNPDNQNPELFRELLLAIEQYASQKIRTTFTYTDGPQVIFSTLVSGFFDLLQQSKARLKMLQATTHTHTHQQAEEAKHEEAAQGQEGKPLSKEEKQRKHLEERIEYLKDFYIQFATQHGGWLTPSY